MKLHNDTKFNTQQLRRIIAASVKHILGPEVRKRLTITVRTGRRGSRANVTEFDILRSYGLTIEDQPRAVIKIPVNHRPIDVGNIAMLAAKCLRSILPDAVRDRQPVFRTASRQRWRNKILAMPLEQATENTKKLDPLAQAVRNLGDACTASDTWKNKMLGAATKVRQYDKKIKYYKARIARMDKEASGEIRKRVRPKAGDRTFTIARGQRNFDT